MGQEAKKTDLDKKQQLKTTDIVHSEMETGAFYNNYASKYVSALFSASLNLGFTHVH